MLDHVPADIYRSQTISAKSIVLDGSIDSIRTYNGGSRYACRLRHISHMLATLNTGYLGIYKNTT